MFYNLGNCLEAGSRRCTALRRYVCTYCLWYLCEICEGVRGRMALGWHKRVQELQVWVWYACTGDCLCHRRGGAGVPGSSSQQGANQSKTKHSVRWKCRYLWCHTTPSLTTIKTSFYIKINKRLGGRLPQFERSFSLSQCRRGLIDHQPVLVWAIECSIWSVRSLF